jgi:hypothetical protein
MKSLIFASAVAAIALVPAAAAPPKKAPRAAPHATPGPPPMMIMTAPPAPPAPPSPPMVEEAADVHGFRAAFVPLVAMPLDVAQKSDPIWAKGDRPAANLIATLSLRPAEAAVAQDYPSAGTSLPMMRALIGHESDYDTVSDMAKAGPGRIYCGQGSKAGAGSRILCLEDENGDGTFERRILGVGERGNLPEQLSILGKSVPLANPVRYRAARADEVEPLRAVFRNCDKDHDRPRYSFGLADSSGGPTLSDLAAAMMVAPGSSAEAGNALVRNQELNALTRGGGSRCQSAEPVAKGDAFYPAAPISKGAVARLGELVIEVGPKDDGAAVRLLGLRAPDRLYRANWSDIQPLAEGPTRKQRELAVAQEFDHPAIVMTGESQIKEGVVTAGDTLLTAGFRHGYMGVLTRDTKIRTLLSSRSLPQGTLLYGIPMASRTITTYGGRPIGLPFSGEGAPETVRLVWCVPVQDETKWSATCIPTAAGNSHTILKGQGPALEVEHLSYAAETASNEGPAPVELKADGKFGRPLSWQLKVKSVTADRIVLSRDTMFGDELINSREEVLPRQTGKATVLLFGDGAISLTEGDAPDKLIAKLELPVREGAAGSLTSGVVTLATLRASIAALPPRKAPTK